MNPGLPLPSLLEPFGVNWTPQTATLAQRLGLRLSESALTGARITHVLRAGAAERAGFSAGDELLALDGWRLRRLDDAQRLLAAGQRGRWLVSRDQRVFELSMALPADAAPGTPGAGGVTLTVDPKPARAVLALRKAWLTG